MAKQNKVLWDDNPIDVTNEANFKDYINGFSSNVQDVLKQLGIEMREKVGIIY